MKRTALILPFLALLLVSPARGWWTNGHSLVAEAAVMALPEEVPAYFREGKALIAHCAQDPDVVKNRQLSSLRQTEEPEHYLDWELLDGRELPASREEFLKLLKTLDKDPDKVGTLPYSILEWTERLTIAFAEHRKYPNNPSIRTKCLVYAGILAHYTGDACMPLHTTIHHDGRARPDGTSPRSGIHSKVDSLIEKLPLTPAEMARDQQVEAAFPLLPAIVAELKKSHALVDRTYELEPHLPPREGAWTPNDDIRAYTRERGRAAAAFTSRMFLSAWRNSARINFPPFLERNDTPPTR